MKFKAGDRVRMTGPYDGFFTEVSGTVDSCGMFGATIVFDDEVRRNYFFRGKKGSEQNCPLHSGWMHPDRLGRSWYTDLSSMELVNPQLELFGRGKDEQIQCRG